VISPTSVSESVLTHCPYCALQCGMGLRSGTVVARDFPTNRGRLCQKGWTSVDLLGSPERLRSPLVRRDGVLKPVDWDTALRFVVDSVRAIQAAYGHDAVAVFGGGGLTNEKAYTLGKFARAALRTKNIDYNGRFCMSSAAAAANRAFGIDRGLPFPLSDLADADLILLVGSNAADTMPPFMQWLTAQRANGGELIVVDPRRTPTAAAASTHLGVTPGTDLALVNGLLNVLIEADAIDHDYIVRRTTGFAEVQRIVSGYGPDRVAELTGVPARQVRDVAERIARAERVILLTARGAEQHSKGVDTVSALINLALALGLPGRPGSGYGCLTGQGNGQGGREHGQKADQLPGYRDIRDPAAREHVGKVWGISPDDLPGPGTSAFELLDELGTERGPRALFLVGSNPVVSAPDSTRVSQRLASLDLLVVHDIVLSESAALADVVLPVTQWAEETGTMTNLEGRVLLRRQAMPAPDGVRSDLQILSDLARRLNAPGEWSDDPETVFDELRRASSGGIADYTGITYRGIADRDGMFWPCPAPGHPGTPRLFMETFPTPDGRARFIGVEHRPVAEPTDADYPLLLTTGRVLAHYQSGAQTRRIRALNAAAPEAFVEIHPTTAAHAGISDADIVEVRSRRGRVEVPARLTEDIRPDTLFMPFHYPGPGNANQVTNPALDPVSKMPEFKVAAVHIRRVRVGSSAGRPASARLICRCNNVTAGDIQARFDAGERTVLQLATSTRATTGCGTCTPAVTRMLRALEHPQPKHRMINRSPDRHVVVVGNGMVGQAFVESLADRDHAGRWRVTVLGEEPRPAYDRVALSSLFDGRTAADLDLVPPDCYDGHRYRLLLNERVVRIDGKQRRVATATGNGYDYDALVLATGSQPFVPPVPGHDLPNCFVYRTIADVEAIKAAAAVAKVRTHGRPTGLVVGGGLLGLEAAHALRLLGVSPHVVELAPRLMPLQVDEGGGRLLKGLIENLDVTVHAGASVSAIRPAGERMVATLSNGVEPVIDVVVFSAGVRPRDQLARESGLAVGERGGIVVDAACRTSDESIYAIGECALVGGRVYGLVGPGYAMAQVAADRLTDTRASFAGADTSTKLKLMGVDVASFGDALATTVGALEVAVSNQVARSYAKLVLDDRASTVLGGVLVGDTTRYATLRALVGKPVPGDPVSLIASAG
jgi:assimilatory nitrate reductase catalytic subunit